ncbi:hypothetical protein [Gluconobacter wancherniae]|uniref:hypothetical protein n=1 Tax=Gluconobacter wancherniae TaxID=1307955 RepID=UPI001B8D6204|nr:hypothetical protein [Gluconobacter wancherniae]MBS1088140.1 hypothetical protein [Gluconobacter wancherniae]
MIWLRKALPKDALLLAPLLRNADFREILRMGEGAPDGVLRRCIERSDMAGIFYDDDRPLCVFGIVGCLDVGHPWLVGTPHLDKVSRSFLRETRRWVQEWKSRYRLLTNRVDADYGSAIRWLEWLGFDVGEPEPCGLNGAMFRTIEMEC